MTQDKIIEAVAGMVILPREPTEAMIEAAKAHPCLCVVNSVIHYCADQSPDGRYPNVGMVAAESYRAMVSAGEAEG